MGGWGGCCSLRQPCLLLVWDGGGSTASAAQAAQGTPNPAACQACAITRMLLPACPQAADLKQGLRFKTLQGGEIGIDSAGIEQEEK